MSINERFVSLVTVTVGEEMLVTASAWGVKRSFEV
jgi:hypothetical protein